jgi:hypothetical protein
MTAVQAIGAAPTPRPPACNAANCWSSSSSAAQIHENSGASPDLKVLFCANADAHRSRCLKGRTSPVCRLRAHRLVMRAAYERCLNAGWRDLTKWAEENFPQFEPNFIKIQKSEYQSFNPILLTITFNDLAWSIIVLKV